MNRYKMRYKSGYSDLPSEIVADGHFRLGLRPCSTERPRTV